MIERKIRDKSFFKSLLNVKTKNTYISFVNPFSYEILNDKPNLIDAVDYFFIDGNLLKFLHNLLHHDARVDRVSFDFSSIAGDVFKFCEDNNLKVGLIGSTESEIDSAITNLRSIYSTLDVRYSRNGFFESESEMIQTSFDMNKINIDIVIIGMGSPHQEKYLSILKEYSNDIMLCFTCGGFLTQTALRPDYYFPLVKKFNLMWLQRIIFHKHVRDRVVKVYPKFVFKYLLSRFGMGKPS